MMGVKPRIFHPIDAVTLEDLVPADSFYRHLDRAFDLAFVRDLVRDYYAVGGRPSIDPVVFFKLQLVMFFEGIRSERQLMAFAADRLSVRWFLGYDLTEPLPDHSSLTRIRDRYGLEIFRRFFEAIVAQCETAGLIWGRDLYLDATQVTANASLDSLAPRFAVDTHLRNLFADAPSEKCAPEDAPAPVLRELPQATRTDLEHANTQRHDWIAQQGDPDRTITRGTYRRRTDYEASRTDPDAALMARKGGGLALGYHDHVVVDGGSARVILGVLVTPADVMENQPALDLIWQTRCRWKLHPMQVTADTTYGTAENIAAIEGQGIHAYVPLSDFDQRSDTYGKQQFRYESARDCYVCPEGIDLPFRKHKHTEGVRLYQAPATTCNVCPVKGKCTDSDRGRQVRRSIAEDDLDRVRGYHGTEPYQRAMRKRQVWVEPLFAEAKQWHGLRRFRLRGLSKVNSEAFMIATGQNLKRLLSRAGWGRRPWPSGSSGLRLAPPWPR